MSCSCAHCLASNAPPFPAACPAPNCRRRQEHLREAAEAEQRAKQIELEEQVGWVLGACLLRHTWPLLGASGAAGCCHRSYSSTLGTRFAPARPPSQLREGQRLRRLAAAEARGDTAAVLALQAERVREEARTAEATAEAQVRPAEGVRCGGECRAKPALWWPELVSCALLICHAYPCRAASACPSAPRSASWPPVTRRPRSATRGCAARWTGEGPMAWGRAAEQCLPHPPSALEC